MDDPGSSSYTIALVSLLLSACFSASESALFSFDVIRLRAAFPDHRNLEKALDLRTKPQDVLSTLLLGNTLVNVVFASVVAAIVLSRLGESRQTAEVLATAVGTVIVLVFGEITPKLVAQINPEKLTLAAVPALSTLERLTKPLSRRISKAATFFARRMPQIDGMDDVLTEARLVAAVEYSGTSGGIRDDERRMIHGLIDSRDLQVKDIMVPRPSMIALQDDRTALDALNLMLRHGVSRIPVYSESRDNITGIVNIKDLATLAGEGGETWQHALAERPAKSCSRPPHFVPETKNVADLLGEMRSTGIHMSIVVDEFDGISGVVTLEDLVEEIVGEIRDEYDTAEQGPVDLGNGAWEMPGRVSLADVESHTGIDIVMEDCDSIAGVVMKCLDRVPIPGDSLTLEDPPIRIEVKEVKGPRILKVVLQRVDTGVSRPNGN